MYYFTMYEKHHIRDMTYIECDTLEIAEQYMRETEDDDEGLVRRIMYRAEFQRIMNK